ncbi:MAG: hypothetical protein WAK35_18905 [Xanthobacteraceae bacterium]
MRVSVTGTLGLTFFVLAVASGQAQTPPPPAMPQAASQAVPPSPAPGFVSSYEIVRTLRSAGFDPLAPPLREGTIYVARATDYRGILMRVVLDARTGAIRDANRIVPGPGNYAGSYGAVYGARAYGPYGPEPYGSGPYDPDPADADDAEPYGPGPYGGAVPLPYGLPRNADAPPPPPIVPRPAVGASVTPLPRPRPPELASRKAVDDAEPSAATDAKASSAKASSAKASSAKASSAKASAAIDIKPGAKPDPKLDQKPPVTAAAPVAPSAPAAQAASPPAAQPKPAKAPSTLTINN